MRDRCIRPVYGAVLMLALAACASRPSALPPGQQLGSYDMARPELLLVSTSGSAASAIEFTLARDAYVTVVDLVPGSEVRLVYPVRSGGRRFAAGRHRLTTLQGQHALSSAPSCETVSFPVVDPTSGRLIAAELDGRNGEGYQNRCLYTRSATSGAATHQRFLVLLATGEPLRFKGRSHGVQLPSALIDPGAAAAALVQLAGGDQATVWSGISVPYNVAR